MTNDKEATSKCAQELVRLRRRVSEHPTDVGILTRLGIFLFAITHETEEAIAVLRSVIAQRGADIEARFWLAKCYFHDLCDADAAADILRQALSLDASRSDCWSLLASAMAEMDKPASDYLGHLREAVRLAPDWFNPRKQLVQALLSNGELEEAERHVQEGILALREVESGEDPITAYYETSVTGRAWRTARAELEALLQQIKAQKTRSALYDVFPAPANRS